MVTRNVRWLLVAAFVLGIVVAATVNAKAADNLQAQLTQLCEENLAAANEENLPRLMATMSAEMPQRAVFVAQCKKEWAQSDVYSRLEKLQVVQVKLPYAIANVTETITGGEGEPEELSDTFGLRTKNPTTTAPVLFKRERGKWKIVASLNEAQAQELVQSPCANGNCQFPVMR